MSDVVINIFFSDTDECVLGVSGCAQMCTNTVGSYTCQCNIGYLLSTDNRGCDGIALQYLLGHRETSQFDRTCRENKAYTLGLSQLLVFIVVAMNTDGFFSYQCICFIFFMIQL